ncbi:MAG: hypothetical protein LUH47_08550 [Clostridiales bacterium]|nr:hypothetical protein [Clostridiales bacterium]
MGRINEVKRGIQLRKLAKQYRVYWESDKTVSQWCRDNGFSQAVFITV